MTGRVLGVATAQACSEILNFNYTSAMVTQAVFTAPFPMIVTSIVGRPRVAGSDGSAVSLSFYKAPSGTAVGSGTKLHSGSYDVKGTADTNQTLTLSNSITDISLATGDSIGYVLTGTATAAVGAISITLEPA